MEGRLPPALRGEVTVRHPRDAEAEGVGVAAVGVGPGLKQRPDDLHALVVKVGEDDGPVQRVFAAAVCLRLQPSGQRALPGGGEARVPLHSAREVLEDADLDVTDEDLDIWGQRRALREGLVQLGGGQQRSLVGRWALWVIRPAVHTAQSGWIIVHGHARGCSETQLPSHPVTR